MKFLNKLFVLLATSSALSYNVNAKIIKRNVELEVNETNLNVSPECQNELNGSKEYRECYLPTITVDNYKELCTVLTSTQCQQFYDKPMSYLPNCQTSQQLVELLSDAMMKNTKSSVKLICNTDESGNLCPMAESLLTEGTIKDKAIKKTCHSKRCIDQALEMYSSIKTTQEGLENLSITTGTTESQSLGNISVITKYLNSKECMAKSGASSLNIGTSLIITLGLLLLSLY